MIICPDYIRYPGETITDADYANDLALLVKTTAQAESQLHCLKQEVRGIGFDLNSVKTAFMCVKEDGAISTLNVQLLKLVDIFMYLVINISSTLSDANMHIGKVSTTFDGLSTI